MSLYLPPAISTSFRFRCAPVGGRMTANPWPAQIYVSITSHWGTQFENNPAHHFQFHASPASRLTPEAERTIPKS